MSEFLNTRISTPIGILILLLVAASVGALIFWQFYELVTIMLEIIE